MKRISDDYEGLVSQNPKSRLRRKGGYDGITMNAPAPTRPKTIKELTVGKPQEFDI